MSSPHPRQKDRSAFLFRIVEWRADFTFGLAHHRAKWQAGWGPYDEYRHIDLRAEALSPAKLSGTIFSVTLAPVAQERFGGSEGRPIGDISQSRREARALAVFPADAAPLLVASLAAGAHRFLELETTLWFRRRADVRRFDLSKYAYRDSFPDVVPQVDGLVEDPDE